MWPPDASAGGRVSTDGWMLGGDMARKAYVYIMSNPRRTVLYIGVTSHLIGRTVQHKAGTGSVFTSQYHCVDLIYYERFDSIEDAIAREKQLKKWNRAWKLRLIRKSNPELRDLSNEIWREND